jgi:hypothetical protein
MIIRHPWHYLKGRILPVGAVKKIEAESLALLRSWCLKSRSLTRRISHV